MYYSTINQFNKDVKNNELNAVAKNLFRYHIIINDISNELYRETCFRISNKRVTVLKYKGETQEITVKNLTTIKK